MKEKVAKAYFERQLLVEGVTPELQRKLSQFPLGCPHTESEREIAGLLFRLGFTSVSSCFDSRKIRDLKEIFPFMEVKKEPGMIFGTTENDLKVEYGETIKVLIPENLSRLFIPVVVSLIFLSVMQEKSSSVPLKSIQLPVSLKPFPYKKKALVVGAGGLGSPAIETLLRNGLENIVVVEHDTISISNIHRQFFYSSKDVGKPKSEVLRNLLSKRDNLSLKIYDEPFKPEILKREFPDIVIACVDNYDARYQINDACYREKIPFIDAGVEGFSGYVMAHRQIDACYRCFVGNDRKDINALKPILPFTSYFGGLLQAAYATHILRNPNIPLKGFWFDLKSLTFTEFNVDKRPDCPVCVTSNRAR
ncbi:hypothetical protein AT15_09710 [Kosmotoga arenicorallina S304]|uniref:THIF-type NAD/FAD binding fold domain-containing protein n=1 Tax=Kosmotoga arenicorallina S304 TaxID=1453497 RepID=A0A176K100_9BACT|nr:ThiF family adenylyltransferase [Kosmotoga arenicorallina]OAA30695.1 hypothetical protein AT15_09710 [Kosmotoga arenicorallina S304]